MSNEPAERDVEALIAVLESADPNPKWAPEQAHAVLTSDWYAERIAEARADAESRARQAWDVHSEHVDRMNTLRLHDMAVADERIAEARLEGAAEALDVAADAAEASEITGLEVTRPRLVAIWLRARAAALRGDA